jgi:hypothetical protein
MTLADDLRWKTQLSLLAKKHFGLFGSEDGREWAVPCGDYQEGLLSDMTEAWGPPNVPLYPLVFSDCVQLMPHQGNKVGLGDERRVAGHILCAEMHLPRVDTPRYWSRPEGGPLRLQPLPAAFRSLGKRRCEITYRWRVDGPVSQDIPYVFVHFTHPKAAGAEHIAFQGGFTPAKPASKWPPSTVVEDGPHVVEVTAEYSGELEVVTGLLGKDGERLWLPAAESGSRRYRVGTLAVREENVAFTPTEPPTQELLWSRGDGGWGAALCALDCVIKNTWEVLSPLNLITAERPMDSHEFLSDDRRVQRTRFGDLTITVAFDHPARVGEHLLPANGFVVESPTFIAFCATRYNGVDYPTPALFTARSLDGKPIAESSRVRIYHGFGDRRIRIAGKDLMVAREEVMALGPGKRP